MPFTPKQTLSESLKSHTKPAHASLEKKLVSKLKRIDSTETYADVLRMMYGYYHPLELLIARHVDPMAWNPENNGRKSKWILDDLQILRNSVYTSPTCDELPTISGSAAAMGALYVLEGSTLGGIHIADMIRKRLDFPGKQPFRFFEAYGSDTGSNWHSFCIYLNGMSYTENERSELMRAATETFELFENWIQQYEQKFIQ